MKKQILPGVLALALLFPLSGCANLLERSYASSAVHVDRPTTAEDPSVLRVENYRELVSAVLYLVSQGAEKGTIQLHDYAGAVETDLPAACVEVATQDPLGAYCVDYIKHEYTRVVSYYQANLDIHYRRSQEQVRSMVRVTGTGAIRTELQESLSRFATEVVLRVAYFSEDEASIDELIRQAYYDTPAAALGFPQAEISLYPESGRERVVEILLTYPESVEELRRQSELLTGQVKALPLPVQGEAPERAARQALSQLWSYAVYAPDGGSTAYDALVSGVADDEGMALAYTLLSRRMGLECWVVEGERAGEPCFWNELSLEEGERKYLDPSEGTGILHTAQELFAAGYRWPDGPQETPEQEENEMERQNMGQIQENIQ